MRLFGPSILLMGLLSSGLSLAPGPAPKAPEAPADRVRKGVDPHGVTAIYEALAPAVVGISSSLRGRDERYIGTGTLIDRSGLILTTLTVVPKDAWRNDAWRIRIYLRGGRVLAGKLVLVAEDAEAALVRIGDGGAATEFPFAVLGDSEAVKVGDLALTLGNAFQSIEDDDQVTLGEGLVSGIYSLLERDLISESKYVGPVIETSASLNSGMDGGPLLDAEGKLIGVLSLGYSRNRWLGTAVPINVLKPLLGERASFSDREAGILAYAGLELEEVETGAGREVRILRVEPDGPASAAGLGTGDRIRSLGGKPIPSIESFRTEFGKARPGERVAVEVSAAKGGGTRSVEVTLWGRF